MRDSFFVYKLIDGRGSTNGGLGIQRDSQNEFEKSLILKGLGDGRNELKIKISKILIKSI